MYRPLRIACLLLLSLCLPGIALAASGKPQDPDTGNAVSRDGLWRQVNESGIARRGERKIVPQAYRSLSLDRTRLESRLAQAPMEDKRGAAASPLLVSLPMPDGSYADFRVVESPIMEPGLAAKFPEIRTYLGQGVDDPTASLRFDVSPAGLRAQILSAKGTTYIDPYQAGDRDHHISYARRDYRRDRDPMKCLVEHDPNDRVTHALEKAASQDGGSIAAVSSGGTLRTYRLAMAATTEYTAFNGGSVAAGMAGIVSTMNRVNGIYEREVGVRMVLVANNNLIVYTNAATDPYQNDGGSAELDRNQTNLDTVIGSANYDIGHLVGTGNGGIAQLRSPCGTSKARGLTGLPSPLGDAFDIDYVAHEMGHQFGGNHTFNGAGGSCSGNASSAAYEPGSGITIQAYAGICSADNLQPNSEDYFHRKSLDEIIAFTTTGTGTCSANTATGNTPPTVTAPADVTIPAQTPFSLTAIGADADGDTLTYVWEEYDLGPRLTTGTLTDNGSNPIFRGFTPSSSPTREFPSLRYQLANANVVPTTSALPGTTTPTTWLSGELLPTTSRAMTFRVTARDNRAGGGGSNDDEVIVTTVSAAGPFAVTAPNSTLTWAAGSAQTVTWNVASTDIAPISTANVRIKLSTDGGQTWPITLAASTANNGSANITVPANTPASLQARVRIEAVGNIYFDISDANFTITNTGNVAPTISVTGEVSTRQGSPTATATVATVADANGDPISVSVLGAPSELTVTASNVSNSIQMSATAACSLVAPTGTSPSSGSKVYPVTLVATDSQGARTTAAVNINVGGNLRPTLGTYADKLTFPSTSSSVTPSVAPSDGNGNLVGTSISPTTLPGGGTVSLNGTTGVVSITTVAGTTLGTYPITISATDTCGGVRSANLNLTVASPDPVLSQTTRTITTGNNLIEPNECNSLNLTVANNGGSSATAVSSTLSTSTPGVSIFQAASAYPDIATATSASNSTPFQISTNSSVQCGSSISLTQTVSYGQNGSPASFNFSLPVGQPPSGNYQFASSTGATVPAGGVLLSGSNADDAILDLVVPSGFNFSVYSTAVTGGSTLRISSNGNLQITATGGSRQWSNTALPSTGTISGGTFPASAPTLLPYWDDLRLDDVVGGGIYTQLVGTAPNRQWVIEWRGRVHLDGATAINTLVALVFNEGSNNFEYRYLQTGTGTSANGGSSTIGVQSASSGTQFTQFSLNTASVTAGTVLTASQPPGICSPGTGVCSAPLPTLSVGDASVTEGNAGARVATFTVSLSAPAPAGGTNFTLATASADSASSSAKAGSDYAATSRSLGIAAGQTSTTFGVKVYGDTRLEPDEFFQVRASSVSGATIANGTGLGTIVNDDSASLLSVDGSPTTPARSIAAIQGNGLVSPHAGERLRVQGIVTALHRDGFHLQSADDEVDGDPASSEGLFIHTGRPHGLQRGDRVEVLGQVQEASATGRLSLSQTRIAAESTQLLARGLPLPAVTTLDATALAATQSPTALERYEGMRIGLPGLRVVAPVSGLVNERDASSSADGRFYGVPQGMARPFREPGLHALETPLLRSGEAQVVFDGNPERLQVDTQSQLGSRALAVDAGDSVSGLVGVLAHGQGAYALLVDPAAPLQVRAGSQPRAVAPAASGEIAIARLDARRLYDDRDDPKAVEPVLQEGAYALRLAKTANAVCSQLRNPAILALAKVEDARVLADLADAVNSRAGNVLFPEACGESPLYRAHMARAVGTQAGDGRLGFLVDATLVRGMPRVQVLSVLAAGDAARFSHADGSHEPLFEAAPQILRARIQLADGRHEPLTLIQVQLRSQQGLDEDAPGQHGWATVADYVRAKRLAQARFVADLAQSRQKADRRERVVLLGGFEASEFSDGRDDLMGLVAGAAPAMANMTLRLPAEQRYSATQEGNAVALDHVLVSQSLLDGRYRLRTEYARSNADFGEDNAGDFAVPLRASDRDATVLYIGQP